MTREMALAYMNGRARLRGPSAQTIENNDLNMMFAFSVHKGSNKTKQSIQEALEKAGPNVITLLDKFHDSLITEFELKPSVSNQTTIMASFMGGEVTKKINSYE